ncbi:MAG: hypothetical protein KAJ48_00050 [Elusimicrobiales bacterium]|nr:hypothetical protein [Elusimicrobiales bacterium]
MTSLEKLRKHAEKVNTRNKTIAKFKRIRAIIRDCAKKDYKVSHKAFKLIIGVCR